MTPILRAAVAKDAPQIAGILISVRTHFMPYAPSAHTDNEIRHWVATGILPAGGVVVAEVDGAIVGLVDAERGTDASWIHQMAVRPDFVGQSIGSTLLAFVMAEFPRPIRLYTFQENTGARRFYETHGFIVIAVTDGQDNEERCPDVLYELAPVQTEA